MHCIECVRVCVCRHTHVCECCLCIGWKHTATHIERKKCHCQRVYMCSRAWCSSDFSCFGLIVLVRPNSKQNEMKLYRNRRRRWSLWWWEMPEEATTTTNCNNERRRRKKTMFAHTLQTVCMAWTLNEISQLNVYVRTSTLAVSNADCAHHTWYIRSLQIHTNINRIYCIAFSSHRNADAYPAKIADVYFICKQQYTRSIAKIEINSHSHSHLAKAWAWARSEAFIIIIT